MDELVLKVLVSIIGNSPNLAGFGIVGGILYKILTKMNERLDEHDEEHHKADVRMTKVETDISHLRRSKGAPVSP